MAGGKETPRQKMISMMYLVLTALLALQVSSAILNKFQDINMSLEAGHSNAIVRNEGTLAALRSAVANAKNNKEDMAVLKKAEALRQETARIHAYLEAQKKALIDKSGGGPDENGAYPGAKEEEPVANFMIGPGDKKNGEAYKMKASLNSYVDYVNKVMKEEELNSKRFALLAMDAKDNPRYADDDAQRTKDFAHLNFESTPLVAALAIISEKQTKLLTMESEALSKLSEKVTGVVIPVDQLRPVVIPRSRMVVAGTPYEGEMIMAASNSKFRPEMTFNGDKLDVDAQGTAKIGFRASGGGYDENGIAKKKFVGTIKYPKPGGGDSIYTIEEDYYVIKPAIQVQAASVQALYRNCANRLSVQVPALGAEYNPKFTMTGGRVIEGSQAGDVLIIPSSPNVTLKVSNAGTFIGERNFKVRLVPRPDLSINIAGRRAVHPTQLSRLYIKAEADPSFIELNPRDATFKVTKYSATLVRSGRSRGSKTIYSDRGNTAEMEQLKNNAQDGDMIVIDVLEVKRKNFQNRWEVVNMPSKVFKINIATTN